MTILIFYNNNRRLKATFDLLALITTLFSAPSLGNFKDSSNALANSDID
jgi:hypothetical protein